MVQYSILDLVPVTEGGSVAEAIAHSVAVAQQAEALGYHRYWVAEHHNMRSIASSATSVLIGHIASQTERIRVGSGGVMLPNHSPMVIAEQFGTLETLYPGRIDLGLGRAPGTDQTTMRALRRDISGSADHFPQDVAELQALLSDHSSLPYTATPGQGTNVPLYLLGSSLFSAQLAAKMGLPYAFALHFAPKMMMQALALYRSLFEPSAVLAKPHVIIGSNVFVAETTAQAQHQFSSLQQRFLGLLKGQQGGLLPPPVDDITALAEPHELMHMDSMLGASIVGDEAQVRHSIQALLAQTEADELMVTAQMYDHQDRLANFAKIAEILQSLQKA